MAHLGGAAEGVALVLDEPLSLWGGVDPETGVIVDRSHQQFGAQIGGRVLVMPYGRGSSGGSGVLAECIRAGTGPVALVMRELDPILLVGALVAGELYDMVCPVVELIDGYEHLATGQHITIETNGSVRVT